MIRALKSKNPAVVGRALSLNGDPHTVIGVLPEDFEFTLRGRAERGGRPVHQPMKRLALSLSRPEFHGGSHTSSTWISSSAGTA